MSALSSLSPSPAPYPPLYAEPETRASRSPKRNFDESSDPLDAEDGDEYGSEAGPKRARLSSRNGGKGKNPMDVDDASDDEVEEEEAPPPPCTRAPISSLSATSEAPSITSLSSITSSSSSSPSPPPARHKQSRASEQVKQTQRKMTAKPLTRRQQMAMGLIDKKTRKAAGVIVIPPGKRCGNATVDAEEENAEWLRNGNGRVDVRGFRELKI